MKIIFVCGSGIVSGKEIITLALIEGLSARGHEVRCVTSKWATADFTKALETKRIPYIRVPLGFISKTLSWPAIGMTIGQGMALPRLWFSYRKYVRNFQPDVVVQTNFHHTIALWPVLDSRKTLFHVHDPFLQTSFYRTVFRILNRRIRFFVGVSNFIRKMIVELGIPEEKALAVLNGIDLSADKTSMSEVTRTNGNNRNGAPTIGIVGQIGEWKGHDDFIEALNGLRQSGVAFHAMIFGDGDEDYVASLKEKIARYDLNQQVRWAGFVKNTRDIFATTDICVIPSRSQDPCPTVAIEAAHCGVPLIATRQGGLPELIRDGTTGYLVDAGAPEQITDKLRTLIEDADLRGRIASAAREHSRRHLTLDRMVSEMEEIFARVVGSEGRLR